MKKLTFTNPNKKISYINVRPDQLINQLILRPTQPSNEKLSRFARDAFTLI